MDTVHTDNGDRHDAIDEALEKQIAESDQPEIAKRTLRRVNKIRRHFGAEPLLELRKGDPGAATNCPIFNSLKGLKRGVKVTGVGGDITLEIDKPSKYPAKEIRDAINGDGVEVSWVGWYGDDGDEPTNDDGPTELTIDAVEAQEFVSKFDGEWDADHSQNELRQRYAFEKSKNAQV
jgi:hypothetical protein